MITISDNPLEVIAQAIIFGYLMGGVVYLMWSVPSIFIYRATRH